MKRIQIFYHLINDELGTVLRTSDENRIKEFFRYMNKHNENTSLYQVFSEVIYTRSEVINRTQDFTR